MIKPKLSQQDLIKEYFVKNPLRDIAHPEVVDWVTAEWKNRTNTIFRDPDRSIRKLHQEGFLIKVNKGIYRYDPDFVKNIELENFTQTQKEEILKKDNYRCAWCGKGKREGVELHIDHIIPKDKGGKATIENGQVLCSQHNFLKKNLNQTETAKKMFVNLYELTKIKDETFLNNFARDILKVFEEYDINGHIDWKK